MKMFLLSGSLETFLFKPLDTLEPDKRLAAIFTYIAFALVAVFVASIVFYFVKKTNTAKNLLKLTGGAFVGFSLVAGITMLVTTIKTDGFEPRLALPIITIMLSALVCVIIAVAVKNKKPEKFKSVAVAVGIVFTVILVIALAFLYGYYKEVIIADEYYDVNEIGLIVSFVIIVAIPAFVITRDKAAAGTKPLVFGALCIAVSFALSYFRLFKMPQGGSITFASLMPLLIYSYYFGIRRGVLTCLAYGILQAIQDPYIVHPIQFLMDYPIAFSFVGFAGAFRKIINGKRILTFCLGAGIAGIMRFVCHVVSGVFAFSVYAPDGISPLIYSLGYNSFVFVDIAISVVIGAVMLASENMSKQLSSMCN